MASDIVNRSLSDIWKERVRRVGVRIIHVRDWLSSRGHSLKIAEHTRFAEGYALGLQHALDLLDNKEAPLPNHEWGFK